MTPYILIIFLFARGGTAVTTQEFMSQEKCLEARTQVINQFTRSLAGDTVRAVCVEK